MNELWKRKSTWTLAGGALVASVLTPVIATAGPTSLGEPLGGGGSVVVAAATAEPSDPAVNSDPGSAAEPQVVTPASPLSPTEANTPVTPRTPATPASADTAQTPPSPVTPNTPSTPNSPTSPRTP